MNVSLRQIHGPWAAGWVLDKHKVSSTFLGHDEHGYARFDTVRTEAGEATYQLKYQGDSGKAMVLAQALAANICPKFSRIDFVMPMPASKHRARQPVTEVANALAALLRKPMCDTVLRKARNGQSLKDLSTKAEKIEAIGGTLTVADQLPSPGPWNVLLIDDLYDSGASMEAACKVLGGYSKVGRIYVAALTWTST